MLEGLACGEEQCGRVCGKQESLYIASQMKADERRGVALMRWFGKELQDSSEQGTDWTHCLRPKERP